MKIYQTAVLTLLTFSLIGCGASSDAPETGTVSGKVTMDGDPVANATITFSPEEGGRPSSGKTNAEGIYELDYSSSVKGAVMGKHKVSVSTYGEGEEDEYGNLGATTKETIPAMYNVETELVYTVDQSSNEINIELKSGGEIIQPDSDTGTDEDL